MVESCWVFCFVFKSVKSVPFVFSHILLSGNSIFLVLLIDVFHRSDWTRKHVVFCPLPAQGSSPKICWRTEWQELKKTHVACLICCACVCLQIVAIFEKLEVKGITWVLILPLRVCTVGQFKVISLKLLPLTNSWSWWLSPENWWNGHLLFVSITPFHCNCTHIFLWGTVSPYSLLCSHSVLMRLISSLALVESLICFSQSVKANHLDVMICSQWLTGGQWNVNLCGARYSEELPWEMLFTWRQYQKVPKSRTWICSFVKATIYISFTLH